MNIPFSLGVVRFVRRPSVKLTHHRERGAVVTVDGKRILRHSIDLVRVSRKGSKA